MIRSILSIDPLQLAAVDRAAADLGVGRAQFIRDVIYTYIKARAEGAAPLLETAPECPRQWHGATRYRLVRGKPCIVDDEGIYHG